MAKKHKKPRGQITVVIDRGTLRLRFPKKMLTDVQKRSNLKWPQYKSLGLAETDPETGQSNMLKAEAIATAIYLDWVHPESDRLLDLTLEKYLGKPVVSPNNKYSAQPQRQLALKEIWDGFCDYHLVGKKETTKQSYAKYGRKLEAWYDCPVDKDLAKKIRQVFIEQSSQTAKYTMAALKNAVDWAINEEIFRGTNPFVGISEEIIHSKRVDKITNLPFEYVAFNNAEVNFILSGFQQNFPQYYNFYRFKFLTGCRTGEAIALRWEDVKFYEKVIFFKKTYSGRQLSAGTKGRGSVKNRQFPLNNCLYHWLWSFREEDHKLVFPNRQGNYLDNSVLSNAWGQMPSPKRKTGVVTQLALAKQLRYLPPYNTRHTFINACIDAGIDTMTIALWCGNSDRVIDSVYKSRSRFVDLSKMPQW